MLNQPTLDLFRSLKLHGMLERFEELLQDPNSQSLSHEEYIALLLEAELNRFQRRRLARLLRAAKLKITTASVEDIDYRAARGLSRRQVQAVNGCQWVDSSINVLLTGETGTGKTWLACAWAMQCLRKGIPVRYFRLSRLLEETEVARGDGSLPKLRLRLAKVPVLILDDWGVTPLSPRNRQDLLEIIEDRCGTGSVVVTSQLPIEAWHDFIGEPTIADAILDRIVHRSHKITLRGESMRKLHAGMPEVSDETV